MSPDHAETVALKALGWLAAHEELLPVFLGSTGGSAEDLRSQATDPAFLAAVLEFITLDDAWVVAFCDSAQLPYDAPLRARHTLPGAEQVHWT